MGSVAARIGLKNLRVKGVLKRWSGIWSLTEGRSCGAAKSGAERASRSRTILDLLPSEEVSRAVTRIFLGCGLVPNLRTCSQRGLRAT